MTNHLGTPGTCRHIVGDEDQSPRQYCGKPARLVLATVMAGKGTLNGAEVEIEKTVTAFLCKDCQGQMEQYILDCSMNEDHWPTAEEKATQQKAEDLARLERIYIECNDTAVKGLARALKDEIERSL